MAIFKRASSQALVLAGVVLGGCAMEGGDGIFTTGSLVSGKQTAEADPACVTLVARIDALRKDGVPDKIEKAAAKRYRMTQADLAKADQLTKANAEFQARCSTVPGARPTTAETPAEPAAKTAPKKAAKASSAKVP